MKGRIYQCFAVSRDSSFVWLANDTLADETPDKAPVLYCDLTDRHYIAKPLEPPVF